MKKQKKLLLTGALLFSIIAVSSVPTEARNVGDLSKFRVTKNGNDTSALRKLNDSNTIINLQNTVGGKQVRVRTRVGQKDVGGTTLWTGTRKSYSDKSAPYQYPFLRISKANKDQSNFTVYGSWSPDSY
ncbi:hypothetical protein IGI37_000328 [Enterococcus sp. AZ194]|uniref:hypothetical protein n=1 Tax=Enterococcus sp. AZ194 TaxID=2774629 RepID=UPI003F2589F1